MLKPTIGYLYTGKFPFTADNALDALQAACCLQLPELVVMATQAILGGLNDDSAARAWTVARSCDAEDVVKAVEDNHLDSVLAAEAFLDADSDTVQVAR